MPFLSSNYDDIDDFSPSLRAARGGGSKFSGRKRTKQEPGTSNLIYTSKHVRKVVSNIEKGRAGRKEPGEQPKAFSTQPTPGRRA